MGSLISEKFGLPSVLVFRNNELLFLYDLSVEKNVLSILLLSKLVSVGEDQDFF